MPDSTGRILVVDDDPTMLRAAGAILRRAGHTVETAPDVAAAVIALTGERFDGILSDIQMPAASGVDLLRIVRERDLDVPVLLMTGDPTLDTAIRAVDYGAAGYLVKPVDAPALLAAIARVVRLSRLAALKRTALALSGEMSGQLSERIALEVHFSHALDSLYPVFQPILSWSKQATVGWEALMRVREGNLRSPPEVLAAAERLGRLPELGRRMRAATAQAASELPEGALLFVNAHPSDLADEALYAAEAPLRANARRVVIEVTERASLDGVAGVVRRTATLRDQGYRLAVDDLGAGYAGLASVVQLDPEVVKIDMSLVRGIDRDGARQRVVRSLLTLCAEMGKTVVSEGVETLAERDALVRLGADWMQGYLFGRPEACIRDASQGSPT